MYIDVSLASQRTYCVCSLGNNKGATTRVAVSDVSGVEKKMKSAKVVLSSLCCNIF